ncbi:hypothetical protein [Saccharothrix australiensis]|uniref:Uncharacterized protein n=1 Tax=Saccharothrix australiensis TaxID=2072 RepID=A0A495W9P9_9PSEU|nr:hypothetical protein [Saccharothrix australiensis]RKT57485.1 hypothetical protein C8E97_6205 [Saccharothrix australiensis]
MDPRARADAALARARARGIHVVTPDNMTSPMDSSATQQIPRSMVDAADPRLADPDSTMVLSAQVASGRAPAPQAAPQAAPAPEPPPQPELRVAPGPVPTVQQVETSRPSLSQRLSGGQEQRPPGLTQRLSGDG